MCLLVVRAPHSTLAPAAMDKLNAICDILEGIGDSSKVAKRNLVRAMILPYLLFHSFVDTTVISVPSAKCNTRPAKL